MAALAITMLAAAAAPAASPSPLRVCADADNMPSSDAKGRGFEDRIAALVAAQLGRPLAYSWVPQRPDLVRNALASGRCDMVVGVPNQADWVETTRPYYCQAMF